MDELRTGWRIAADTGGTFTDVMGTAPDGSVRRVKVLSSGALRLRVRSAYGNCIRLRGEEDLPDGFFKGFRIRSVNTGACDYPVLNYRALARELILKGDPERRIGPGDAIELTAGEEAPVLGARMLTGTPPGQALPLAEFRIATTRGTNALLEENGAPVVFFVTRGFGDLLWIGDQKRPDLFALNPVRPAPLHSKVVEVPERIDAEGEVVDRLDVDALKPVLRNLRENGFSVAAVALLHSYRNPAHEQALAEALEATGFDYVAQSAALAPFIKVVPRAGTAVVDAYLGPLLRDYLDRVGSAIGGASAGCGHDGLRVMNSAGGMVSRGRFRAKDSLLSGPAGGVVGVAAVGRRAGEARLISFDMGGTSTDVARVDGVPDLASEHRVGRAHLLASALRIETVAAGGGSICGFRDGSVFVGPESAGASPGPAAYGAGGPLTVTDVNLLLGRLYEKNFGIPVDRSSALDAYEKLHRAITEAVEEVPADEVLLEGFLKIANQRMADAIRGISIREGYDPADYTLLAFGGAGGQHACAVADNLGMDRILSPSDAGLLSAYGLACARVERVVEKQVLEELPSVSPVIEEFLEAMRLEAVRQIEAEGFGGNSVEVTRREVFLRFAGQETACSVFHSRGVDLASAFMDEHRRLFGYVPEGRRIEVVRLRLVAAAGGEEAAPECFDPDPERLPLSKGSQRCHVGGAWAQVPVFERAGLDAGSVIKAPAMVTDPYTTLLVEPGWEGSVGSCGSVRLHRVAGGPEEGAEDSLIAQELFANRLTHIVEEMGEQLRRTALSTNIKERLDFSCGLLDREGRLIANAPHIPVHLGALGLCVRSVARKLSLKPGDVVLTNHPGFGGSHLPDLTVITPVFGRNERLLGYVANRAHHAELGGIRPGSMPPDAKSLEEEGVVISPRFCLRSGENHLKAIETVLREAPHPSRSVADNLADLDAQLAANRLGAAALEALAGETGPDELEQHMRRLYGRAADAIRSRLDSFAGRELESVERLDDGSILKVRFRFGEGGVTVDFTGTSGRHPANLNATPAIVQSALIYVFRLLVEDTIPLNEGLLDRVELILPKGSLLNPDFPEAAADCPPVVGGNVELSQRLIDTLLKPFGVVACSQGTMNNFVFGGEECPSYYETLCGGSGAGPEFDGASAVHTHMTNTAITDPEILEHRYPVRLERFAIRTGSGGAGRHRGGDGVVREFRFLKPVTASLLTQHRVERPYGLDGGEPGAGGRQLRIEADGAVTELPGWIQLDVPGGDRIVIESPGGGGFGRESS